jgi:hypothetical protein
VAKKKEEKKVVGKQTPLARQKDEHGSKEKLVDKLVSQLGSIGRAASDKDSLKSTLLAASNKKLLRLFEVSAEIKEKFGSVEKLAEATAKALGRAKDAPYLGKLKELSPGRLLDAFRSASKREKAGKAA